MSTLGMKGRSLQELHLELQQCQRRLGTTCESREDFERALHLAHQINNEITAKYLMAATSEESVRLQRVFAHAYRGLGRPGAS